jgi:hypothetical protein
MRGISINSHSEEGSIHSEGLKKTKCKDTRLEMQ